ncbi:MAG: HD domain-containing phosphohydrolase [Candidatus Bipolaricaulia bacterium]
MAKSNTDVRLLARHDSIEVMKQKIASGSTFYLDSSEDWQGFEFIYVIKGSMEYTNQEKPIELEPGDYIARRDVPEESWFTTKTDVTLLYTSSQPSFYLLREEIEDYLNLAREVEATEEMSGHSKRLVRMSFKLGKKLGLSTDRLGDLKYAAFFHDIGKSEVPNRMLEKEGQLTEEEWEIMEKHTLWGREMLEKVDHLERAGEIIEQTHERLDGEGYPNELTEEEISLEAKIIAVVDAWDAMRTDRPYRDALSKEEAINELETNKGSQFAPEVVNTFLKILQNRGRENAELGQRDKYKDETLHLRRREVLHNLSKEVLLAENREEIMRTALEAALESTRFQRGILSLFDKPIDPDNPSSVKVERFFHRGLTTDEINQLKEANVEELEVNTKKFDEKYQLSRSYYVPHEERQEKFDEEVTLESKLQSERTLDWHPDDSLYIPLHRGNKIIGQISVDDPEDGLVPEPEDLQPLENFVIVASLGLEKLDLAEETKEKVK